jgi:membrane-associated phospholipid phosphatase
VNFLTDFADQAVVLPLVVAVAVVLGLQGWWRGALVWFGTIAGTFAVMLALKLFFMGCSVVFGPLGLRSPSGHVAAASVIAGALVVVLGRERALILPIVALATVVIGFTRIGLHVHSWPEVILGGGVGLAGALVLVGGAGPPPRLRLSPLIITAAVVLAVFHGQHLEAELAIRQAASEAGLAPAWCQGKRLPARTASNPSVGILDPHDVVLAQVSP